MELIPRFFTAPAGSFFLFGPRGTGKSTWLRKNFAEDGLWIDLLLPDEFRRLQARPELLKERVQGQPEKRTIIIDEVQKAPQLLDVVHHLMESDRERRFILTGSSARKLKRAGVDLLAGRAVLRTFHPFLASELGSAFSLEEALRFGQIPLVWSSEDRRSTVESYIALYLREEVQAEGLVRRLDAFARFLEAVSFSHGSVLNISNVARECQVERKSVQGYLEILEDLLLAFRVPVFSKRPQRDTVVHPKLYLMDTGVYRALRPSGPLDRPGEIEGAALEGLVAQHLRAWIAYSSDRNALYYWRTRIGQEVDFIVYGDSGLWALEVKQSAQVRPQDIKGLQAFVEEYPEAKPLLLYRGENRLLKEGILCIPCEEFLRQLLPNTPLWNPPG